MAWTVKTSPTTDRQIRTALKAALRADDSSAALFDELSLCRGKAYADIAAVNGHLCGFEIKSANDGLSRLRSQVDAYDRVFEYSSAVVAGKHLNAVRRSLPSRWGLMVASVSDGIVEIEQIRKPRINRGTDPVSVMRLMWREEIIRVLRRHGVQIRSNALVSEVWKTAIAALRPRSIADETKAALKARIVPESDLL